MLSRLAFFLALAGCAAISHPTTPPMLPADAAISVKTDLSLAIENVGSDHEVAEQYWARAYDTFELQIEPGIRSHCGRRAATEIEYAFGAIRSSLDDAEDATRATVGLQAAIDRCVLRIPIPR